MSEWKVNQALVASVQALGLPDGKVAYEQREFTPPADGSLWYALNNLPAARDPKTMGDEGVDDYTGVFQIDVYAQQGRGMRDVIKAAEALTANYTAGKSFVHEGQIVRVRRSNASPARRDGVRLVISVSVYWTSDIPRNP